MAFDGIVTNAIVAELYNIIGSKIDKIYEPDKNTIVLGLYLNGKHFALNVCIDAHNCRLNLTTHSKTNPIVAPNFCMLLRKHLIGGKISNISMLGLERLVKIDVETINDLNKIEVKTLIIELMGKHSNVILINQNNIIIDSLRHTDSNNNSYRNIFPSSLYTYPNSDKYDFTKLKDFDDFYSKLSDIENDLTKSICNAFTGFSSSFVNYAIQNCKIKNTSKEEINKIYNYFINILNSKSLNFKKISEKDYVLTLGNSNDLYHLNFFIDDFYFERKSIETFTNYRNSILKLILEVLKKYTNRLHSINSKLEECADMDKYKLYGELITANLYQLTNTHTDFIELENYYDNNNYIRIPLNKKFSPGTNAKRYFKKYTKLKNAFQIVYEQKHSTEIELNYIESIVYELENCSNIEDVQAIFEEISENIVFKERLNKKKKEKKNNSSKKKKNISFSPIEYSIDGYKIYVGRNNKENDWLTFSFANKNDLWFHTKNVHGSHVILKVDKLIDNNILIKCAQIAAIHSKANMSSNVPVDYCLAQFVKKPSGSKPGMVIFTNNKTLNVNPQDLKIKRG